MRTFIEHKIIVWLFWALFFSSFFSTTENCVCLKRTHAKAGNCWDYITGYTLSYRLIAQFLSTYQLILFHYLTLPNTAVTFHSQPILLHFNANKSPNNFSKFYFFNLFSTGDFLSSPRTRIEFADCYLLFSIRFWRGKNLMKPKKIKTQSNEMDFDCLSCDCRPTTFSCLFVFSLSRTNSNSTKFDITIDVEKRERAREYAFTRTHTNSGNESQRLLWMDEMKTEWAGECVHSMRAKRDSHGTRKTDGRHARCTRVVYTHARTIMGYAINRLDFWI